MNYCEAIGIHFWVTPYNVDAATDLDSWGSAYNYMRNVVFADDNREIIVSSCGWPWAVQGREDPNKPVDPWYQPVAAPESAIEPFKALTELDQCDYVAGEQRFGISSLFYDSTRPALWYFTDVNMCFNDGNWLALTDLGPRYCGLGNTYTDNGSIGADPLVPSNPPTIWTTNHEAVPVDSVGVDLWPFYVGWIENTEGQ